MRRFVALAMLWSVFGCQGLGKPNDRLAGGASPGETLIALAVQPPDADEEPAPPARTVPALVTPPEAAQQRERAVQTLLAQEEALRQQHRAAAQDLVARQVVA